MLLNRGRPMVAIPGPSIIPDRVLAAMHRPLPNIYEGDLADLTDSLLEDLPKVVGTAGRVFLAVANGHGAWQMAIANTMSRGDKVLVLESGRFAIHWGEMAARSGVDVEVLAGTERGPVIPGDLEARLRADTAGDIKAILVAHVDTATSVCNDIVALSDAIDAAGHDALFMVDGIASLGSERFEMDNWRVDLTVGGSQKGLMVPPGLSFVWANERAQAASERSDLRETYWDWEDRLSGGAHYHRYAGTPPIQHIYAMREALDMIFEEGLENIWQRHRILADAVRAAVEAWGGPLELNIESPSARSNAVTTVRTSGLDVDRLRSVAERGAGLTLGLGIPPFDQRGFRIGHMGHLNPPMILGTLGTLEAALIGLDVDIAASGVAAAAAVVAPHLGA